MGRNQVDLSISVRCVHTRAHTVPMVAVCSDVQVCVQIHTWRVYSIKKKLRVEPLPGAGAGGRTVWEFAVDVYTLLHLTWARPTVRTGNPAQGHVAAGMGVESGGEDTWTCAAESLCCLPETVPAFSIAVLRCETSEDRMGHSCVEGKGAAEPCLRGEGRLGGRVVVS